MVSFPPQQSSINEPYPIFSGAEMVPEPSKSPVLKLHPVTV